MPSLKQITALHRYVRSAPSDQEAVDLYRGRWSSRFPPPFDQLDAGESPLFEDPRMHWCIDRLGITGSSVLELGPLEGGHSYMLDRAGAARVVSIEANRDAYLRCLIAKEIVGMPSVEFLLGDGVEYLAECPPVDTVIASGVLYHLQDPVSLLQRISEKCSAVFLWTHVYDREILAGKFNLKRRFGRAETVERHGFRHTVYRRYYDAALFKRRFIGGSETTTHWITKEDLLSAFRHFGFRNIECAFEDNTHAHGPSLAVRARKPAHQQSKHRTLNV
jgi:protein-L-isoaspartate O-methyltransferase